MTIVGTATEVEVLHLSCRKKCGDGKWKLTSYSKVVFGRYIPILKIIEAHIAQLCSEGVLKDDVDEFPVAYWFDGPPWAHC